MIAKLTGTVDTVAADSVVLDVAGVGYLLTCSGRTLARLVRGETASLTVETFIRDDRIVLYGFAGGGERDWFRLLTAIQGVGSRSALAILSVLDPDQLAQAIAAQDKAALSRADGVGPKLAARIANELKDKVGALPAATGAAAAPAAKGAAAPAGGGAMADAVSALINLGYGRSEAYGAAVAASRAAGDGAAVGDLIRLALKELSQ